MNKFWAFFWYALRNRQHPAQISTPFLSYLIRRKSTKIWDFWSLPVLTWKDFSSVPENVAFSLCASRRHKTVQLNIHSFLLLALDEVRIRLHVPAALAAEQFLQFLLMGSWLGLSRSGCFGEERRSFPPKGNPNTTFRCSLQSLAWANTTLISVWEKEKFPLNSIFF